MSDDFETLLPPPVAKPLAAARRRLRKRLPAPAEPKPRRRRGKTRTADAPPPILEFCTDWLGIRPTPAQAIMLRVACGEALDDRDLPLFRQMTGRTVDPRNRFANLSALAGARGGKSGFVAVPLALYHSIFGGHEPAVGEKLRFGFLAQDSDAAGTAFDYAVSYVEGSAQLRDRVIGRPYRRRMVIRNMQDHPVEFRCYPCTSKTARSYSFIGAILDEVAYFRYSAGAANQDTEVEASIRRGMLNTSNPLLIKISTPAGKDGILYRDFQSHFGRDDALDLVVFRAPSIVMNPGISADRLAQEQRLLDPAVYEREYEAEFMDAASAWLPSALIEAAVDLDVTERPPAPGTVYTAAIDPSGGAGCAFAFTIGHAEMREGVKHFVVDVCRRWMKPKDGQLDLRATVAEIIAECRAYRVEKIYSDRYGGQWPAQTVRDVSDGKIILLDPVIRRNDGSEAFQHKSDAFTEAGPYFRAGTMHLVDDPQLIREFKQLELRPKPAGRIEIGRPKVRGALDDSANSTALACAMAVAVPKSSATVTAITKSWTPSMTATGREVAKGVREVVGKEHTYSVRTKFGVEEFTDPRGL